VVAGAVAPTWSADQQLRPRRGDDQNRRIGQLGRQALDLGQRIVVGVLQVLADDDQRTEGGVLLEESPQDGARQLRPLLGASGQRAAEGALRRIEAQEPPEQRRELGDAPVAEHLLQLPAKLKQRLVGRELGQAEADPQQMRDEGAARGRGRHGWPDRRPHDPQILARVSRQPLVEEPALAEPVRADDGDGLGRVEADRPAERLIQGRKLGPPPDEPRPLRLHRPCLAPTARDCPVSRPSGSFGHISMMTTPR